MDWGWGDSVGEEGADSEESLCTGMIFFLTELLGSLFLIHPSIACNYHTGNYSSSNWARAQDKMHPRMHQGE